MRLLLSLLLISAWPAIAAENTTNSKVESKPVAVKSPSTDNNKAEAKAKDTKEAASEDEEPAEDRIVNLENEDAFIDLSDALKSKHFVRRAILNTAIKNSSKFHLGRPYANHLVGFSAIVQREPFAKSVTAMQGIGGGYVFGFGLGVEAGFEFSALSNLFLGTRYHFDQMSAFVWPFVGFGLTKEISFLSVSDLARELWTYAGPDTAVNINFGIMVPLVDIGLKAEVRANFYGSERVIITTGLGAILFI